VPPPQDDPLRFDHHLPRQPDEEEDGDLQHQARTAATYHQAVHGHQAGLFRSARRHLCRRTTKDRSREGGGKQRARTREKDEKKMVATAWKKRELSITAPGCLEE
jgi:hypothetical protein